MMTNFKYQNQLASLIEAPTHLSCRPGTPHFGNNLATCIISINPMECSFYQALDKIINTRLELAVKGGDREVIKTLMLFKETREKGLTLRGMEGKSFTKIDDKGKYAQLYDLILSAYFQTNSKFYDCDNQLPGLGTWTQQIEYNPENRTIFYHHVADAQVPMILTYLNLLWNRVLSCHPFEAAIDELARFEWWFISPNITGRAGASIGNCLSLVLQRELRLQLSDGYEHMDWKILSCPLDHYITWRRNRLV